MAIVETYINNINLYRYPMTKNQKPKPTIKLKILIIFYKLIS